MTELTNHQAPRPSAYLGLLLVSSSTLMLELLLTRIFSVTLWYHFAFMVVSIALFGMTAGALLVYLRPRGFAPAQTVNLLTLSAVLFALATVIDFLIHVQFPAIAQSGSPLGPGPFLAIYLLMALPFFFGGINVTIALTKLSPRIGRLYAADLGGAAVGCLVFVVVLELTDGATAVFLSALVACLGGLAYARDRAAARGLRVSACLVCLALLAAAIGQYVSMRAGSPWVALRWVKGRQEERPLIERWNSFSRITVWGDPERETPVFGFGFPLANRPTDQARQLRLEIDASADTYLTGFEGNLSSVAYLQQDVTYAAHVLRPDSRVLVIGSGGGRDLLAALAFGQPEVQGVEVNGDIVDLVHDTLGDFTGHLDTLPGVSVIADEARSFVARQNRPYDIIQISLIDTWAASSAGAFVLTEHGLYTVEAWESFLAHLTPRGVLSVSRWYFPDNPYETYRLIALASEALRHTGTLEPRAHLMLLTNSDPEASQDAPVGIATLLVLREPLAEEDIRRLEAYTGERGFQILLSPRTGLDPVLAEVAEAEDFAAVGAGWQESIEPPTDDRPFFFFGVRIGDLLMGRVDREALPAATSGAVYILSVLTVSVVGLALLALLVPLVITRRGVSLGAAWPLFVYFAAIGLGYLLVEVSQLQRLMIFLGHPTYGVTVVLFTLLAGSGAGSFTSHSLGASRRWGGRGARLVGLLLALIGYGVVTPVVLHACQAFPTPARVLLVMLLLFPVGFLMGMPFPLGMEWASDRNPDLKPWLFGLNGAMSVAASVLAVVIALNSGITAAFAAGLAAYAAAGVAYLAGSRSGSRS
jgi:hypothetical protein